MARRPWCFLVILSVFVMPSVSAQQAASAPQPPAQPQAPHPTTTLQGEVVDPGLYLREARHGREVEELMYDAVEGGQSLALLQDGTQALILFLASQPGEDPNELVYDYAGRKVKVTGAVYERGGFKGLVVENVESLDKDVAPPRDLPPDERP